MKRQVIILAVLVSFSLLPSQLGSQETPAAAAERQEAEERYKRMSSDIEDLKTTIQSLQRRLTEQRDEIRRLNEDLTRATSNKELATKDDLKRLADKVKEVDERRVSDNTKVMTELNRIASTISAPPKRIQPAPTAPDKPPAKPDKPDKPEPASDKFSEYTIRSGDHPKVISQGLAKQGIKVTQQQIIDANPKVDWTRLKIGQKILIPVPPPPP